MALLLNGAKDLVTKNTEIPEVLNAFLMQVFSGANSV